MLCKNKIERVRESERVREWESGRVGEKEKTCLTHAYKFERDIKSEGDNTTE
jgi:hypothetical protein